MGRVLSQPSVNILNLLLKRGLCVVYKSTRPCSRPPRTCACPFGRQDQCNKHRGVESRVGKLRSSRRREEDKLEIYFINKTSQLSQMLYKAMCYNIDEITIFLSVLTLLTKEIGIYQSTVDQTVLLSEQNGVSEQSELTPF